MSGEDAYDVDGSLAAGDGPSAVASERVFRPVMTLLLVRGSSFFTAAAAPADPVIMDAQVWSEMPDEMMWEVLRFVPAAELFQLQLVSPKWRRFLTSAHFRKQFTECHLQQQQQQQELPVACLWRRHGFASSDWSSSNSSVNSKVLHVDLSTFVPSSFLSNCKSKLKTYFVMAAAHGLVCIRNTLGAESVTIMRYCVVNPLTRTCTVLPELPFSPDRLELPSSTSVAILFRSDTAWHWATYDLLAAGAGWVAAVKLDLPRGDPWPQPVGALLGGQTYWCICNDNRVVVMAAAGVKVGALDAPSLRLLGLDEASVSLEDTHDFRDRQDSRSGVVCA